MLCALLSSLEVCVFCHFHLWHFIVSLIMLFLACNSFFSAAKSSWELQTAHSFLIHVVIVLSPMTGRSQSHTFLLFSSGEKWRFDLLRGEWNNLIECAYAFCFMQFHVGPSEIPPNHVRLDSGIGNSSCHFVVYGSKLCFSLFSLFWHVYIFLFTSNT